MSLQGSHFIRVEKHIAYVKPVREELIGYFMGQSDAETISAFESIIDLDEGFSFDGGILIQWFMFASYPESERMVFITESKYQKVITENWVLRDIASVCSWPQLAIHI